MFSNYVLVNESRIAGMDLSHYLDLTRCFTFFPENLDNLPTKSLTPGSVGLNACTLRGFGRTRFNIDVSLRTADGKGHWRAKALIDSGAEGIFLDRKFAAANKIPRQELSGTVPVYNVDGTENSSGGITHITALEMQAQTHKENLRFYITDLGGSDVILGLPWLEKHNPDIDWRSKEVSFGADADDESGDTSESEGPSIRRIDATRAERRRWKRQGVLEHFKDEIWISAGHTYSTLIAEKAGAEKRKKSFDETVPEHYREFRDLFDEEEPNKLPEHKPYDHKIELKEGTPDQGMSRVHPCRYLHPCHRYLWR